MPDVPAPDARVCFNCSHLLWLAESGRGFLCKHSSNQEPDGSFMVVPSPGHTCELFEPAPDERRRGWCGF